MPELRCTVQSCKHNQDYYCKLDGIVVGGNNAKHAKDTCCDSFEERSNSSMNSSMSSAEGKASPTSNIDCKAVECTYNKDCVCHAGKISVEGSGACQCEQTECATFTCGCGRQ